MLDLTPGLEIEPRLHRTYFFLRLFLYVIFVGLTIFIAFRFVFPNEDRYFDFRIYLGPKNTIAAPRLVTGEAIEKGTLRENQKMIFNAAAVGSFSKVAVLLSSLGKEEPTGTLSVIRAYRAFLYPEGETLKFRNGSLLTENGNYYILSQGKLRRFANWDIAETMGWKQEQFLSIAWGEVLREVPGKEITDPAENIEDMLIQYGENYYVLKNGSLTSFVSKRAYLSRFPENGSLSIDENTLARFPASEAMIGFLDGTLISYGPSVYAVSGETLRPIDSIDTFLEKGYRWESVIPATGEEFGLYTRGKLYTVKEPHPDGTIFYFKEKSKYFLVEKGQKREIPLEIVHEQFSSIAPILVETLPSPESCTLAYSPLWNHSVCAIPLEKFNTSTADEYEFTYTPATPVALREMNANFLRDINRENFSYFVSDLTVKFGTRYGSSI